MHDYNLVTHECSSRAFELLNVSVLINVNFSLCKNSSFVFE